MNALTAKKLITLRDRYLTTHSSAALTKIQDIMLGLLEGASTASERAAIVRFDTFARLNVLVGS